MRRALLYGLAAAGAVACQGGGYFSCDDDGDCSTAEGAGICQPARACSFPDDTCATGQRYGAQSPPPLAGECVGVDRDPTDGLESSSGASEDPVTSTSGPSPGDSTGPVDTGNECPAGWWDCAWAHRQQLTLAQAVDDPLTDVPVLVLLTAGRVDHERMQADGEDVRFVSADGTSMPHEIERWDPQGVSILWVRVTELGGPADHLWLYYGNAVAEGADAPGGVWSGPYAGVWHLEDEPVDATANGNHATVAGSTAVVGGQIGSARDLQGYSARLDVGATPSLGDVLVGGGTISAWIRPRGWGGSGYGRIADKDGDVGGWFFNIGSGGQLRFGFAFDGGGPTIWATLNEAIERHRWTHVAVTYDVLGDAVPQLYVDGVVQELENPPEQPLTTEAPSDLDLPLSLGNRPANDRRFDGTLDEIRIEATIRSAEWLRVQAISGRDELLSYGPIESWEGRP